MRARRPAPIATGVAGRALLASLAITASFAVPALGGEARPGNAPAAAPLAAQGCLGCHGPNGAGLGSGAALAGRDAGELASLMRAYRANERPGTIMGRIARGYTDAEIDAVAAHYAAIR